MRRIEPDIFRRKWVITIPPWGVPVLFGGVIVGIAVPVAEGLIVDVAAFTITLFAFIQIFLARRALKQVRWDIHRMMRDIGNDAIPDEELYDDDVQPAIRLTDFSQMRKTKSNKVNGSSLSG